MLAQSFERLGTETAFVMLAKAKALERQGKTITHLEIGEPDFDTPKHIKDECHKALVENATHYTPSNGLLSLRQSVAGYIKRTRNATVDPDNVVIMPGAKPVIFYSLMVLLNPGDEVIYPDPGFPIYESMIKYLGAIPKPLALKPELGFHFDPNELMGMLSKKTKLIIVNSPHNPTGSVLNKTEMEALKNALDKSNALLFSDEIYDLILYDGMKHVSPISMPGVLERTIVLGGFSKNYAMTGWRLGYGIYPKKEIAVAVSQLITNCHSCTNQFVQQAGIVALEGTHKPTEDMVAIFERRRNLIMQLLDDIGLKYVRPQGAFYINFDVRPLGITSKQFALDLLYKYDTCTLDAVCFGSQGDGFIRLSYATSEAMIRKGLGQIGKFVEELRRNPPAAPVAPVAPPSADATLVKDLDDIGFLTAMTIVLMCNYASSGHFGGPMSYTPGVVTAHLGGPENGCLSYDIRDPKMPLTDRFMMTGGHCAPTCYALWMVLYQAMESQYKATGDEKYRCDPKVAILPVDIVGFRRSPGKCAAILHESGLQNHPMFAQAKGRGVRALMGHTETTDCTNDVNGGPSGIGVSTSAGKAMFWDKVGASSKLKVMAFEGEFALTEGHAQELKTIAVAQQVGKRLRLFFSFNNAGIDDSLVGGVVPDNLASGYDVAKQFSSYGWRVYELEDGSDYAGLLRMYREMEMHPFEDKRPLVIIANTVKGWWPAASSLKVDQIIGHKSHPFGFKPINAPYVCELMRTFEERFGVSFDKKRPANERERLMQCKHNVDVAMSILEKNGGYLRRMIAGRLINIAETIPESKVAVPDMDPFSHPDLSPERLQNVGDVKLFLPVGTKKGARRAVSEVGRYINMLTDNRWVTIAADLSGSINVEKASITGHYDPVRNPEGSRLKAGIQEAANASTICGLVSQTLSTKYHAGFYGVTGTYGSFTPLFYTPIRVFSQQNQDSPFPLGVVTVVAGHSGPETAADARTHFGIFAPQVWNLFPRKQIINVYPWDYNDVAPAYFAALKHAVNTKEVGVVVLHVARPDNVIIDKNIFHDKWSLAATRGCYLFQDYKSGPREGVILLQGTSSTQNFLKIWDQVKGHNIKVVSVISEDLFRIQDESFRDSIFSFEDRFNCMFITTFTKRAPPLSGLGPLTEKYSLSADFDDRWRTGGTETDVIAEAHLDEFSILKGVQRFIADHNLRMRQQQQGVACKL